MSGRISPPLRPCRLMCVQEDVCFLPARSSLLISCVDVLNISTQTFSLAAEPTSPQSAGARQPLCFLSWWITSIPHASLRLPYVSSSVTPTGPCFDTALGKINVAYRGRVFAVESSWIEHDGQKMKVKKKKKITSLISFKQPKCK